jgi:hypothetical protein
MVAEGTSDCGLQIAECGLKTQNQSEIRILKSEIRCPPLSLFSTDGAAMRVPMFTFSFQA